MSHLLVFWLVVGLLSSVALLAVIVADRQCSGWSYRPLVMLALLVLALSMYLSDGRLSTLRQYWHLQSEAERVQAAMQTLKNPNQIIDRLHHYLQLHPNHPKGWYLLGKLYLREQRFEIAHEMLSKAVQLAPNEKQYVLTRVEASFYLHHQQLTPKDRAALRRVLQHHPNDIAALNLLAIDDNLKRHYASAIQTWEKLLTYFPAGSDDQKKLLLMIAQAEKQLESKKTHE